MREALCKREDGAVEGMTGIFTYARHAKMPFQLCAANELWYNFTP
jgi:hypothetical protein